MDKCYLFYKGRVALYALLKALGVSGGDRVMIPGYTCIVVPLAVYYASASPEYYDINSESYNASLADYEAAYQRLADKSLAYTIKVIIIQHTYGNANKDTQEIVAWARKLGKKKRNIDY